MASEGSDNRGTTVLPTTHYYIQVVGSSVSVQGTVHFTGNNAEHIDGGALYLQSFGQLQLRKGAQLIFKNNIGR